MEGSQLEFYKDRLKEEIENKKYFLKQASDAIKDLDQNYENLNEDKQQWQEFLQKPMFYPDRSDPLGIALASVQLSARRLTSKQVVESPTLTDLENMVFHQRSLNADMALLRNSLLKRSTRASNDTTERVETSQQRHERLQAILKGLTEEYLAVDLVDVETQTATLMEDMYSIIQRLVNYDETLKMSDFRHNCMGLYRLLLRGNLIEKLPLNENKNDFYIRMVDFRAVF